MWNRKYASASLSPNELINDLDWKPKNLSPAGGRNVGGSGGSRRPSICSAGATSKQTLGELLVSKVMDSSSVYVWIIYIFAVFDDNETGSFYKHLWRVEMTRITSPLRREVNETVGIYKEARD